MDQNQYLKRQWAFLEEQEEDKMQIKEKLIGIILIILGALPFLLKIESISTFFTENKILSFFAPGEIIYQIVIIILGALLIWRIQPRVESI